MNWFSTKVRLICLVEKTGGIRYMDSVHVFRATDFESARYAALRLGRAHEEEFRNSDGELVRWRLKELVSLDFLGADVVDGAEVYSEPVPLEAGLVIAFETDFEPERSNPTQTVPS
jgi:hypothetical protein